MDNLEVTYEKVEELIPYVNNSRTHSDKQITQICSSINEYGFTTPIIIDEQKNVLAGHGRLEAVKRLGWSEVPCVTLKGLTKAQKKAYVIADNKLALNADWDLNTLENELKGLKELDFDLELTGFDDFELDNLLREDETIQDNTIEDVMENAKTELGESTTKTHICPNCGCEFED